MKGLAKKAGWNLLYTAGFMVAVVAVGAFMLYGLPLMDHWYGFVGMTALFVLVVNLFDLDY